MNFPGIWVLSLAGAALVASGCATSGRHSANPLRTVEAVDLNRYAGTWFEIARLPNRFEKDCYAVTATYSLRDDGKIKVVNRCRKGSFDGKLDEANGKAWPVEGSNNARLKVSFFWPFHGDYWVVDLGTAYEYAIVGSPDRKYLWFLSRTPVIESGLFEQLVVHARQEGFDVAQLIRTPQRENAP